MTVEQKAAMMDEIQENFIQQDGILFSTDDFLPLVYFKDALREVKSDSICCALEFLYAASIITSQFLPVHHKLLEIYQIRQERLFEQKTPIKGQ